MARSRRVGAAQPAPRGRAIVGNVAAALALVACTPSAPARPADHAVVPATAGAVVVPAPPAPAADAGRPLPPCTNERRALARHDDKTVADFDVACLPLLDRAGDVSFVKSLSLSGSPERASDLAPLGRLPALESIWIDIRPMVSLSALSRIRSLRRVKIMNPLETLEPLRELTQIKSLHLDAMEPAVPDVSTLSHLTTLQSFDSWQRVDLAAVARAAPKLAELGAYNASGFDALARFGELRALRLSCFDSKKQRLPEPPKLESLAVSCNDPTAPMDPLVSFPDVKELDLSAVNPSYPEHSPLRSLSLVGRMKKLRRLDIRGTRVRSLAPLAHCPDLGWLHIDDTRVRSLAPLARLKHLQEIDATNAPLTSIAPLAASPSLVTLWLPGTHVQSVLPLAGIKTLEELMLPGSCARPDAVALAKRRPDVKLMMWTDGGSPDCKR